MGRGGDRVHVGDDVFADALIELQHALVVFAARVDKQHIAAAQHVGDDARGSRAFHRVVFVEGEFGVAGSDIENAYCSPHCPSFHALIPASAIRNHRSRAFS